MFTGLVEALATVRAIDRGQLGAKLTLETELGPLVLGESISVNGVCLTVSRIVPGGFVAHVSAESLQVTTLHTFRTGVRVNVERALQLGGRLGGHLVSGHVDGVAMVVSVQTVGEARRITLRPPAAVLRFLAAKGSVTLDGVSLTVNNLGDTGDFDVMVVPHTLAGTTLASLRAGALLNLEVDVLARYAARLLEAAGVVPSAGGAGDAADVKDASLMGALQRGGYV